MARYLKNVDKKQRMYWLAFRDEDKQLGIFEPLTQKERSERWKKTNSEAWKKSHREAVRRWRKKQNDR